MERANQWKKRTLRLNEMRANREKGIRENNEKSHSTWEQTGTKNWGGLDFYTRIGGKKMSEESMGGQKGS